MKEILTKIMAPATEGGNLSIGRLMMLVCFGLAAYTWGIKHTEIPNTQLTVLLTLIGYILGTKVLNGVKDMMTSVNDAKKATETKVEE